MRSVSGKLAVVATLLAALTTGCQPSSTKTGEDPARIAAQPQRVNVSSFDAFNKDLANRVTSVLVPGGAPDFQVVVTPATDPIGTLYRRGRSVPFDDKACAPPSEPSPRNMPNVFPSYQLDAQVALEFGLDEAVLQGIAEAGASVARGSSFSFSVLNPQLKVLSDTAIRQVFADTACTAAAKGEMVIVRGYVLGQRRFSTKADGRGNVRVGVTKVGKFNVEGSNAGLLSITDEAPQEFLQILSEVSTSPTSPANTPADIAAPRPVTGQGRIYVQQDRADDVRNGRQTIALLAAAGFKVEPRVEGTASKLTPNQPQIRYFNEADKPNATRVLETFKEKYPEAVLVPLKIQAPPGQLEVWLPRVKTPPDAATPSVNTPR